MTSAKKKIKIKTDTRLKVFRNIRKTLKYYFKNIFYIIFINTFFIIIFNNFFRLNYLRIIQDNIQSKNLVYILYYILPIMFLLVIKVILYGNTVYVMKFNGINDIKDLFSLVIRRFLPTFGTLIVFIFCVMIFSIFFIIPGIMYFFYYYFSVFLTGVGDINDKQKNEPKSINGLKAVGRSYILVRNNLFRFSFLTTVIFILTFALERLFIATSINLEFPIDNNFVTIARFCIFDIFLIYSALIFVKFEGIENDIAEERFKRNQEEEVMLSGAIVNKFGKSKK